MNYRKKYQLIFEILQVIYMVNLGSKFLNTSSKLSTISYFTFSKLGRSGQIY